MFEHLDDTGICVAPPVAEVRHRARQIVAHRRRTQLAVGSAAVAVSGVAGVSVILPTAHPSVTGLAVGSGPKPSAADGKSPDALVPSPEASVKKPAADSTGKSLDDGLNAKPFVAGSATFIRQCTSAYEAMKPSYLPAGLALASEQPPSGNRVDVAGRAYENADDTRFLQVSVICNEDGAKADGEPGAVVKDVTVGGHPAVLTSYGNAYATVTWQLGDNVLVRVQTKAPTPIVQPRVSDEELLDVAASLPTK